jgi:MFS family permease
MTEAEKPIESISTRVSARLDRLPWSRFHTLIVFALGITWILDGLEVTIVGSLSPAIEKGLSLTATQIGLLGSAYIAGAVIGALLFGRLTDSWGRRRLFFITVLVYLLATIASGFSWDFWSLALFRLITGMGIGGEYAAVNSAIQELVPARRRGFVDLAINGSYWVGAALGAVGSVIVLNPALVPQDVGWRLAFIIGGLLAIIIIWVRRYVPESPRWLITHGRVEDGERIVGEIERGVERQHGVTLQHHTLPAMRLRPRKSVGIVDVIQVLVRRYPKRTVLGVTLMATQAFCYNAIFFTYALILTKFYAVPDQDVGWFMLPFAAGNFLGPLLLGNLFDSIGRKAMIASTYALAGVLLAITGALFAQGVLTAVTQTAAWCIIFFFASAGASAAYLTVGESFPLETRAMTIGLFYAFGTAIGGIGGPALFGALIESGQRVQILSGYVLGGGLMLLAAIVTIFLGVRAERRPLEDVARPLSVLDDE